MSAQKVRTITCDHPGCLSFCELGPLVTEKTLFKNLADRGWQTVTLGDTDLAPRHFCQRHHEAQSPLVPDANKIKVPAYDVLDAK